MGEYTIIEKKTVVYQNTLFTVWMKLMRKSTSFNWLNYDGVSYQNPFKKTRTSAVKTIIPRFIHTVIICISTTCHLLFRVPSHAVLKG